MRKKFSSRRKGKSLSWLKIWVALRGKIHFEKLKREIMIGGKFTKNFQVFLTSKIIVILIITEGKIF